MKRMLSLLVALVMVLGLCAVAHADAPKDNMLHMFLTSDPESLDGQMTTDSYTFPLNVFDRLVECVTVDGKPQIVPGLADSWDVSPDGLNYTFHLHQGVKFSNGNDFTAQDVVFTINRMMNPKQLAKNTDIFSMIAGANDFYDGKADSVSGVVAKDDYTVVITLAVPYAPCLAILSTPGASILDSDATTTAGDKFGMDPALTIGTGPFILKSWTLGNEVTVVSNQNYFKGAPKIDGIVFSIVPDQDTERMLFENGSADIFNFEYAPSQLQFFMDDPKYKDMLVSGPRAGTDYLVFNENIEPLNNPKVREAIAMALDKQLILEVMFNGHGSVSNTLLPTTVLGFNADSKSVTYDPEAAKKLLADAGYPNGFDMVIAQTTDSPQTLQRNEIIQGMLAEIGINVTINQMDSASYYGTRSEGTLPSCTSNWSADFNDPDNFLYTFFSTRNAAARSINYVNADVQAQLENARAMVDPAARMKTYQDLEQTILYTDWAMVPLFQIEHMFLVNSRVKNFKVSWNGWNDQSFYGIEIEN